MLQVGHEKKKFTVTDGYLGLAPLPIDQKEKLQYHFLYQLRKQGYIDFLQYSLYLSNEIGDTTHIKFGGYDPEGILPGSELKYLETVENRSWKLNLKSLTLNKDLIQFDTRRNAVFEMAFPYLYCP